MIISEDGSERPMSEAEREAYQRSFMARFRQLSPHPQRPCASVTCDGECGLPEHQPMRPGEEMEP